MSVEWVFQFESLFTVNFIGKHHSSSNFFVNSGHVLYHSFKSFQEYVRPVLSHVTSILSFQEKVTESTLLTTYAHFHSQAESLNKTSFQLESFNEIKEYGESDSQM